MGKPWYMPWNVYISDRWDRFWDSIRGKIECRRGEHSVKMDSYGECIRCGKKVV